jgi:hypothetical protein
MKTGSLNGIKLSTFAAVGLCILAFTNQAQAGGGSGHGAPFSLNALNCDSRPEGFNQNIRGIDLVLALDQGRLPILRLTDGLIDEDTFEQKVFEQITTADLASMMKGPTVAVRSKDGAVSISLPVSELLFRERITGKLSFKGEEVSVICTAKMEALKVFLQKVQ